MWIYSAYASIGTSHERHHLPCQDAVAVTSQDNILIGAMADGAGSTTHGGVGARIAVQEFLDFFCKQHLEDLDLESSDTQYKVADLFEDAHATILEALMSHVNKTKTSLENFASTFMGVISTPYFTVIGHIGDGFVVIRSDGSYTLAAAEAQKEFVNQTTFITDSHGYLEVSIIPTPIEFLAMGTDGLADVCLEQKPMKPHANFFKPFDDYLESYPAPEDSQHELEAFLSSEKLNARTQDDKALLIARWMHD